MARFVENFFRYWPRLLLPVLLVGGLAAYIGWTQPAQYQTEAAIWTDKPTFLDTAYTGNPELTPAQSQLNRLTQSLQSQNFLDGLVERIKQENPDLPNSWDYHKLAKVYKMTVEGNNLISVVATGDTPKLAHDEALLLYTLFRERYTRELQSQSDQTIKLYQTRLDEINTKQDSLTKAINAFLTDHPTLRENPQAAALEPDLARLRQQNDYYQSLADGYQGKIEQVRQSATLGTQGDAFLRLEDQPKTPPERTSSSRVSGAILFGVLGAIAGLVLGSLYLIITTAFSKTFYRTKELARLTGLPTYGINYQKPARVRVIKQQAIPADKGGPVAEANNPTADSLQEELVKQ